MNVVSGTAAIPEETLAFVHKQKKKSIEHSLTR